MKPRSSADYRLLAWTLLLTPSLPTAALLVPSLAIALLPVALYFAYCIGIASHYHNHRTVFANRLANQLYSMWLSIFYGVPLFAWIPTHNRNHHKFVDGEGDETRTRVLTTRNSLSQAVLYPFRSARAQFPLIWRYAMRARRKRPRHFLEIVAQTSTLVLAHLTFAGAAIALHGVGEGIGIYFLALGLPSAFASWSMMFTNFVQHVGCNSQSQHDHSRNFESRTLNWLVFNSGYHTVHHEQPGRHWSDYAKLHAERRGQISAELNWPSIGAYCRHTYFPKAGEASASPRSPTPPGQRASPPLV